jgi:hypothetical protein
MSQEETQLALESGQTGQGVALKPCPFCGAALFVNGTKYNPWAKCKTKDCMGSRLPVINLDDTKAIEAWNTRTALPEHCNSSDADLIAELELQLIERSEDNLALNA